MKPCKSNIQCLLYNFTTCRHYYIYTTNYIYISYLTRMQSPQLSNQPIITEEHPFIVKVKLLSNQTYEINTNPQTSVSDFKKLVFEKTKVPVERQRIVFGGKQLVDQMPLSEYVKESGLTVHLIAKAPVENPPTINSQNNQPQQQNIQRPPIPPMPMPMPLNFGNIFGMMGNPPDQGQMNQQMNQSIGNAVNSLMGGLGNMPPIGIRVVHGPINPSQIPNPNQPGNPFVQNLQQSNPNNIPNLPIPTIPAHINPRVLQHLEQSINRINLPNQHVATSSLRQSTAAYLRRLQNQMLRFIPQLNRGIQLLQEGRVTHLSDFVPIFQSLNQANIVAIESIQRLGQQSHSHPTNNPQLNQNTRQQNNNQQANIPQTNNNGNINTTNTNQSNNTSQSNTNPLSPPEITATLVIEEIDGPEQQQNNQENLAGSNSVTFNLSTNGQGSNIMSVLGNIMQPNSGFNLANIFGSFGQPPQPPPPPPPQQPQQAQQEQQLQSNTQSINPIPASQQPLNQQNSEVPQQNTQQTGPIQSSNAVQQNPLAGVNMMSMFNSLQQSGGIGTLLNMSLGGMLEDQGNPPTIYSCILAPITGGEVMACFTQKDFSFFDKKRVQFKEATLKAISLVGSRQELVKTFTCDLQSLLVPETGISQIESCKKKVNKILTLYIERIVGNMLQSSEVSLTEIILRDLKTMYCEAIEVVAHHSQNIDSVFLNLKNNTVAKLEKVVPGLSGIFYSIVERDLVRIYRQYIQEKKRRQELSEEEAKDESDLLQKIAEGKEDDQNMANFQHSQLYPKTKNE